MNNLVSRRHDICGEHGASLYYETRELEAFRLGRESLYDAIAQIDAQRAGLERQIESISAEVASEEPKAGDEQVDKGPTCPHCGSPCEPGDTCCMNCGEP